MLTEFLILDQINIRKENISHESLVANTKAMQVENDIKSSKPPPD